MLRDVVQAVCGHRLVPPCYIGSGPGLMLPRPPISGAEWEEVLMS
ncbi:hypothetical protein CPter91_1088 [Collimonas pratensis]|uniref:Uncharacterized protein n=1 Tax=Collimonas pratensis TaxID=279113 RepID=A0A127Q0B6_9BURK|nr:hypothetical protein CPter91_1088 [Collimonas pratensis]